MSNINEFELKLPQSAMPLLLSIVMAHILLLLIFFFNYFFCGVMVIFLCKLLLYYTNKINQTRFLILDNNEQKIFLKKKNHIIITDYSFKSVLFEIGRDYTILSVKLHNKRIKRILKIPKITYNLNSMLQVANEWGIENEEVGIDVSLSDIIWKPQHWHEIFD